MKRLPVFVSCVAVVGLLATGASAAKTGESQSATARRDAERMARSLEAILVRAATPAPAGTPVPPLRTSFTDAELNAWLADGGKDNLPTGLVGPRVTFTAPGKVSVHGVVDLDAVRKSKERGWFDPLAYLNGFMEISLDGTFSGTNGQGTFDVATATLGNVSVPRVFLQELIAFYSKSPELPDGVILAKPFPLPAGVRDVKIVRGSATVVQ